MSSMSVSSLVVAVNAATHCGSIPRFTNSNNMNHLIVLATFKVEHEVFISMKDEDDSKVSTFNDRHNDREIVHWAPIFKVCLAISRGSLVPLNYVLRDDLEIPDESVDPLIDD